MKCMRNHQSQSMSNNQNDNFHTSCWLHYQKKEQGTLRHINFKIKKHLIYKTGIHFGQDLNKFRNFRNTISKCWKKHSKKNFNHINLYRLGLIILKDLNKRYNLKINFRYKSNKMGHIYNKYWILQSNLFHSLRHMFNYL